MQLPTVVGGQNWFYNLINKNAFLAFIYTYMGFPGIVVKNLHDNAGDSRDTDLNRKAPWKRKCNSLQYSCLENSMDRLAWWATVHRVSKSWTQLSTYTYI